jgi:hypothetical protein
LVLRDASELKTLFCVSRNEIAQKTIGDILSGDSDWDRYWDTTDLSAPGSRPMSEFVSKL